MDDIQTEGSAALRLEEFGDSPFAVAFAMEELLPKGPWKSVRI